MVQNYICVYYIYITDKIIVMHIVKKKTSCVFIL